ncbi:MAG: hypothetical protein D6832_02760 [Alphaproteobacteria bacterium]|nr:MAG: hypothetical protein D6832_02760 [Alphaproteobacteria bacterium]
MKDGLSRRESILTLATAAGAVALGAGIPRPARADSDTTEFVQVNMWDRGPDVMAAFDFSNRIMLGTPGAAFKDEAPMGFTLNKHVIPRGKVKFIAVNTSETMEHEMLVVPIEDVTKPLPYDTDAERVKEEAAKALGEIAETPPGETGTVTLDLEPGIYMLLCNIPNHYAMGMWTLIVVI